jgi:hypothetical protein
VGSGSVTRGRDGINGRVDIYGTDFDLSELNWLQIGLIVSKDFGDNDGSFSCISMGSSLFTYLFFISALMENGWLFKAATVWLMVIIANKC